MIVHHDKDKYHTRKFACGTRYQPKSDKQAWQSGPGIPDSVNCKKCIAKHKRSRKP